MYYFLGINSLSNELFLFRKDEINPLMETLKEYRDWLNSRELIDIHNGFLPEPLIRVNRYHSHNKTAPESPNDNSSLTNYMNSIQEYKEYISPSLFLNEYRYTFNQYRRRVNDAYYYIERGLELQHIENDKSKSERHLRLDREVQRILLDELSRNCHELMTMDIINKIKDITK